MGAFDPRGASVVELAAALRSGAVTAVELARYAAKRAETIGRKHTAIAAMTDGRAIREATRADARLAEGDAGPLVGIPYGAKDIIAARGAPTSWGVTSLVAREIDEDATVVDRLHRAGCVLVAKLTTTGLAGGGGVSSPGASVHGQPRNPWAPDRYTGGSSSGSATAVALGIVPFALGSETGGSVINPAGHCGVTGYRPTWGLIPRSGVMMLSARLDKVGLLARTAEDCAHVADAIAGPDGTDEDCRAAELAEPKPVDRVRLGISPREQDNVAESVRVCARRCLDELAQLVGEVRAAEIPADIGYASAIETIMLVDAAASLRSLIWSPDVELADQEQLHRLRGAESTVSRADYARADDVRGATAASFREVFRDVDVLATVGSPAQPQLLDAPRRPRGSATVSERMLSAANLAGLPGVSIPCGLDDEGLPVSIHLVGPAHSDRLLLAVAARFQEVTDHHRRLPPGSGRV
jgi:aspartyl-tRNA(Asn)/glutamyl-tRNA(Gln) amidotransferase subunit A